MSIIDLAKADEKDAKLTLKLKAKSGYSATETHEISANQWAYILAICVDGPMRRQMSAAPELLEALQALLSEIDGAGISSDGWSAPSIHSDEINAARAAIAKARGETS